MKCQSDIENLAKEKLIDAECLFSNGRFSAAYYLGGYAIELMLKAKVCKNIGIEDFFDFNNPAKKKIKNDANLYRPFKVHDYEQLLVLSGIYAQFEEMLNNDIEFKTDWSIVSKWNEDARYLTGFNSADVNDFLISTKKIVVWIQKFL
jgi:hypothetical protein